MEHKLTKYEKSLVAPRVAAVRKRTLEQTRMARAGGMAAGLLAAKLDASGALSMEIPLPMVGKRKVSELAGWGLMILPLLQKNPSVITQASGMAGLVLVARAVKK